MKSVKIILTVLLLSLVMLWASAAGCHSMAASVSGVRAFNGICARSEKSDCVYVCSHEDCHETGRHCHDGVYYCGYSHEGGVCDGSCLNVCPPTGGNGSYDNGASRGHHGSHHGGHHGR